MLKLYMIGVGAGFTYNFQEGPQNSGWGEDHYFLSAIKSLKWFFLKFSLILKDVRPNFHVCQNNVVDKIYTLQYSNAASIELLSLQRLYYDFAFLLCFICYVLSFTLGK